MAIELRPPPAEPKEPVTVKVAPLPVPAEDFRLAHKTSDRAFYDKAREESGAFEVLFRDKDGFLTEGTFTSLFVVKSVYKTLHRERYSRPLPATADYRDYLASPEYRPVYLMVSPAVGSVP